MSPAPAFRCRGCDNPHLTLVLPLGPMPLANALPAAQETAEEARHPLDVAFCPECTLVQITETVPPETLFREYLYFSSFSDAMVRHGRDIARRLANVRQLGPSHLVVEIASNDGYLLQHFVAMNVPVLGIEPAANIAQVARDRGVRTMAEFFGSALADRLRSEGVRADVILANNVIAHIPDINGAMAGIKTLLHDDGVFVMETPYIKDLVDHLEFDTIYHEHLFYYSLTALERLFRRHGLAAASVERIPIHGGSLRVSVTHEGAEVDRESVAALLDEEAAWGVADERFYSDFAVRVAGL